MCVDDDAWHAGLVLKVFEIGFSAHDDIFDEPQDFPGAEKGLGVREPSQHVVKLLAFRPFSAFCIWADAAEIGARRRRCQQNGALSVGVQFLDAVPQGLVCVFEDVPPLLEVGPPLAGDQGARLIDLPRDPVPDPLGCPERCRPLRVLCHIHQTH